MTKNSWKSIMATSAYSKLSLVTCFYLRIWSICKNRGVKYARLINNVKFNKKDKLQLTNTGYAGRLILWYNKIRWERFQCLSALERDLIRALDPKTTYHVRKEDILSILLLRARLYFKDLPRRHSIRWIKQVCRVRPWDESKNVEVANLILLIGRRVLRNHHFSISYEMSDAVFNRIKNLGVEPNAIKSLTKTIGKKRRSKKAFIHLVAGGMKGKNKAEAVLTALKYGRKCRIFGFDIGTILGDVSAENIDPYLMGGSNRLKRKILGLLVACNNPEIIRSAFAVSAQHQRLFGGSEGLRRFFYQNITMENDALYPETVVALLPRILADDPLSAVDSRALLCAEQDPFIVYLALRILQIRNMGLKAEPASLGKWLNYDALQPLCNSLTPLGSHVGSIKNI
jgi:hypothetical protein